MRGFGEYFVKATQSKYTEDGPMMVETTMLVNAENDLDACRKLYARLDQNMMLVSNFAMPTKIIKMEEESK